MSLRASRCAWATLLLTMFACGEGPSSPGASGPGSAASHVGEANGGGKPSGLSVSSVSPDSSVQNQTLDVIISGSGFEPGSSVDWAIAGVPTTKIQTNHATVQSSKRILANITVAADAPLVFYDVEVTTPPGRRGIGSESFRVVGETRIDVLYPSNAISSGYRIYGDAPDGGGLYLDGVCGTSGHLFDSPSVSNPTPSYDAVMDPDVHFKKKRQVDGCSQRTIAIDFSCEVGGPCVPGTDVRPHGTFMNIRRLGLLFPAGTPVPTPWVATEAQFNPGFCALGLRYDPAMHPGTSQVQVRLVGRFPSRWEVRALPVAQGGLGDVALCRRNTQGKDPEPSRYFHLPFFLTIIGDR